MFRRKRLPNYKRAQAGRTLAVSRHWEHRPITSPGSVEVKRPAPVVLETPKTPKPVPAAECPKWARQGVLMMVNSFPGVWTLSPVRAASMLTYIAGMYSSFGARLLKSVANGDFVLLWLSRKEEMVIMKFDLHDPASLF